MRASEGVAIVRTLESAVGLAQFKHMALVAKVEALNSDAHPQVGKFGRIVRRRPGHPGAILAAPHGFKLPLSGFVNFFGASVHGRACVLCSILVRRFRLATPAGRAAHVHAFSWAVRVFPKVWPPLVARQGPRAANHGHRVKMSFAASVSVDVGRYSVVREHAVAVAVVAVFTAARFGTSA
jgi:hypothetical protein